MSGEHDARAEYEAAVSAVRSWRAARYLPAKDRYVAAVRDGQGSDVLALLAAELADIADEAEDLWVKVMFVPMASQPGADSFLTNEYAGDWAALSDLWSELEDAHASRQDDRDPGK